MVSTKSGGAVWELDFAALAGGDAGRVVLAAGDDPDESRQGEACAQRHVLLIEVVRDGQQYPPLERARQRGPSDA